MLIHELKHIFVPVKNEVLYGDANMLTLLILSVKGLNAKVFSPTFPIIFIK